MKIKATKPGRLKAAILDWLGIPIKLTDHSFWGEWGGTVTASGVSVDHHKMLTLSAVWACTRLIAETIATLPLSMYEKTTLGRRVAQQHPLQCRRLTLQHAHLHLDRDPEHPGPVFHPFVAALGGHRLRARERSRCSFQSPRLGVPHTLGQGSFSARRRSTLLPLHADGPS